MTFKWHWSLVVIAFVGLAAAALPIVFFWSQLPQPMAVHWSATFEPDGSMAKARAILLNAALIGVPLLVSLMGAAAAQARGRAVRLLLVTFVSCVAAATSATIVARNLGKSDWTEAEPLTFGLLSLQLGIASVAGLIAFFVASRLWRDPAAAAPGSAAALPLAAGARAYWSGGALNRWLLLIGGLLLLQAIVLLTLFPRLRTLPIFLALHVLGFVVVELFSRIRVTIDGRGVRVRYGHLGLWTSLVPLDGIAAAHAIELDALEHGGWGYRGGLRLFGKASIVVRSGPALRLALAGGKQLFITVDDAATAAQLLNALLARKPPSAAGTVLGTDPGTTSIG